MCVRELLIASQIIVFIMWRRVRDSNPRYALTYTPLAGARLQPLGQLSIGSGNSNLYA